MFVTELAETARALDQLDQMLAALNQQRHEAPRQHNNENDNNNDNNDSGHGSSSRGIACCFVKTCKICLCCRIPPLYNL